MSQQGNLGQVFEEVVSVEACHSPYDPISGVATVHADVSFLHAKLGDEEDCPVRFSLAVRRAEVHFSIPATEPLAVLQSSVAREQAPVGQKKLEVTTGSSGGANAGVSISTHHPSNIGMELGAHVSAERRTKTSLELTENIGRYIVKHFSNSGAQCWEITTASSGLLLGKPWDPVLEPRLRIKKSGSSPLEPMARLAIKCRREDIVISNLAFKSSRTLGLTPWQTTKTRRRLLQRTCARSLPTITCAPQTLTKNSPLF